MGKQQLAHSYEYIISIENLLAAWQEFVRGKRGRRDVQCFERNLMDNIFALNRDLAQKMYEHGPYHAFNISDSKPRNIHKASVRDRLLHRALYRVLYPFFDSRFIIDSYSCRQCKGTHKALNQFKVYARKASRNYTRTVWVLKCDIKKFFANIDHGILKRIITNYIPDSDIRVLLSKIISSFHTTQKGRGLPLGNLTSQLLINIYMNEFDQYVKHKLKAGYYIRYADDFVILSADKQYLIDVLTLIRDFLSNSLRLYLHHNKVSIGTVASGMDFLGWVHFPDHRVLRTASKRRMFKNLATKWGTIHTYQSYCGMLEYGNTFGLRQKIARLDTITN